MSIESDQKIHALEQKILDFPEEIRFHISLGQHYLGDGRLREAESAGQAAVQIDPANPTAHFLLTESLIQQNKLTLANKAIDRALQSLTETPELLAKASEVRHIAGRLPEAENFLSRALTQSPRNTRLRFQYAHLILEQCRYAEAIDAFSELSEGHFFKDDALAAIGQAWERQGELEKAHQYIDRALGCSRKPSAFVLQTLADVAYQTGELDRAIKALLAAAQRPGRSASDLASLHFSLGRLLDKRSKYGDAFSHYRMANELLAPVYDWRRLGATCQALIEKFSAQTMQSMPAVALSSNKPVFIVGLPRSGTSLVERIFASHPDAHGAGELEHIRFIAGDIERRTGKQNPGPGDLASLGPEQLNQFATRYLDHLDSLNKDAKRIIDKMPGNLMYLGLISALFPRARIIHCVRNPLDTCLSCYFQRFHRSNSLAYTFNLEALAYTWKEQERLMAHWKSVLPIPIMDVAYEDLVNNFDFTAKLLLEFCGLEWDDSVRSFYRSDNDCYTASYEQVRKPIYRSSLNRWRNYEPYIQPLIDRLGGVG